MEHMYELKGTEAIISPSLIYYEEIIRENIKKTIRTAGSPERLWPHVKSHKSMDMVRMQMEYGITKFKTATVAEAEMAAMAGAQRVILAYPLVGPNMERFVRLAKAYPDTIFYGVEDDRAQFEALSRVCVEHDAVLPMLVDVNMGMNGIDEKQMMLETIYEVTGTVDCPLCIDSSHVDIIEAALRIYPGRALINSISYEKEKFERLLPIAKKYGAMFILLPLSDEGIPKTTEEKRQIVRTIMEAALAIGMRKEDIIVDGLVATVGANPEAALECFDTIRYCKEELELATICGLSNISFGLPARQYVNTAFLTMAISKGLSMAIANPSQELLMNAAFASDMLLHKEESDIRYITRMNRLENRGQELTGKNETAGKTGADGQPLSPKELAGSKVFEQVLDGNKGGILKTVEAALAAGWEPGEIIDNYLIPAINEVGVLFDKQIYFLPQLIS